MRFRPRAALVAVLLIAAGLFAAATAAADTELSSAEARACADQCTGDEPDGDCSAGCDDCGCCRGLAAAAALPSAGGGSRATASDVAIEPPAAYSDALLAQVFRPPRR